MRRDHHHDRHDGRKVYPTRKTLSSDAPGFSKREGSPEGAMVVFADPAGDARRCGPLCQRLIEESVICLSGSRTLKPASNFLRSYNHTLSLQSIITRWPLSI